MLLNHPGEHRLCHPARLGRQDHRCGKVRQRPRLHRTIHQLVRSADRRTRPEAFRRTRTSIAVARTILKDASILILDEATCSLDSKSERQSCQHCEPQGPRRTANASNCSTSAPECTPSGAARDPRARSHLGADTGSALGFVPDQGQAGAMRGNDWTPACSNLATCLTYRTSRLSWRRPPVRR